ncbi:uncharacterized protein [Prorops nasuta]|uniref:uncharacterized protein n=1 Tax=Prorops nasuta TaxID=863751 RepID=UPI0034CDE208
MTLKQFNELLKMTAPFLKKKSGRALPPELRLIIVLRYLATGDSPLTIALSFRVGESTVRSLVKEVCSVLIKVLEPLYLALPNEEDWRHIANGYWNRWNLPNCIGAIDGKHIRIRCPPNSGSLYFNYKKYYSIVLMAISDHVYRFTLVDIGGYGGNSDGGIFNESNIGINLINNNLNLPQNEIKLPNSSLRTSTYFIADDAFKLSKRIMKPYSGTNLSYDKRIFNYRISRARLTVESAFGILSNKWRICHTVMSVLPETADIIVTASVCLHNFILKEEENSQYKNYSREIVSDNTVNTDNMDFTWINIPNSSQTENEITNGEIQRQVLSNYFLSEDGKVMWQHEYIQRGKYRDE